MTETNLSGQSFSNTIFLLLALLISFLFIGQIISAALLFAYYGSQALDFETILSNQQDSFNFIRLVQILVSIFCFAFPAMIFSYIKTKNIFQYSFQNKKQTILLWILVPFLVITIYPLLNLTYVWNKQSIFGEWMVEQQAQYKMFIEALLSPTTVDYFLLNFLMVAIVPAFVEEWLFRGTLQKQLSEKWNAHLAIWISSIVFSLIHFEFSAFIPRIILGILLGYIFYFTKNIWLCIWMHLFNNGMEVTSMYIKNIRGDADALYQEPSRPTSIELIGFSLLFMLLFYVFYKIAKKNKLAIFAN